ncbi:hypothetical protein DDJ98_02595 [Mycobacteroides abscessus]|nr:hypothetical protein DDJ98_02595 [Mycobacteroides abscessus]
MRIQRTETEPTQKRMIIALVVIRFCVAANWWKRIRWSARRGMGNVSLAHRHDRGYILPATIMLSLGIAIFSVTLLQMTANANEALTAQSYQSIAEDAAQSGIVYADSCLQQGTAVATWTNANQLKPNTGCNGTTISGSAYIAEQGTEWRSYFSVAPADADGNVVSTGYVEVLNNGIKVKTYKSTSKMPVSSSYITHPISSGESLTNVKAQNTDCATANGKLYCWGRNTYGQVGDNTTTDRPNPVLVQGALAGKTVTTVDVSDTSVCATADGVPYCWGSNSQGQLGNGSSTLIDTAAVKQPTANIPSMGSGALSGHFITDIATAPARLPATIPPWPLAYALQHSCALRDDGAASCWGSNGFRQLSTKARFCAGIQTPFTGDTCIGFEIFAYPDSQSPILINGYGNADVNSSAPWQGKKAVRVAASSHDSCLLADGRMYCMGVEVPLIPTCTFPSPLFLPANIISINLNVCNVAFSGGYDMSGKQDLLSWLGLPNLGFTLNDRVIDPSSWGIGANLACGMANTSLFCVGEGPSVGFQWGASFKSPWQEIADADVTSYDNGDNENPLTLNADGMSCIIDKGIPKCHMAVVGALTYNGGAPLGETWGSINITRLQGSIPTAIAAGTQHGCLAGNGRLYCWGFGDNGRLANGNAGGVLGIGNNIQYATHTGTGGTTPIGSLEGTYAANGPVSTGDGHTCAIANGQLACWGKNDSGQLGTGDNANQSQPLIVPLLRGQYVNKVSAGANHTCAIKFGKLYCWGLNTSGQLGTGNATNYNEPQLVAATSSGQMFYGKRITAVSAGVDDTCAIADGKLYCWGNNANSKLGLTNSTYNTPQLVSGRGDLAAGAAVTEVSTGTNHTCAVANADAYCWGKNDSGQLGTGNTTNYSTPKLLTGGTAGTPTGPNSMRPSVSDVSAGKDFSCGIFNGTVSCWGSNTDGQLGTGTESWTEYGTPYNVACDYTLYPLNPNGCSGYTSFTGCGFLNLKPCGYKTITPSTPHTNESRDKNVPTKIQGAAGGYYATQVSAGTSHTCALLHGNSSATNGNIWCWGAGANGRLGNNATTDSTTPVLVNSGATVDTTAPTSPVNVQRRVATYISSGASNSCSVANAVVLCWGNNANSRLGDGTTAEARVPGVTLGYRDINPYIRGPIF